MDARSHAKVGGAPSRTARIASDLITAVLAVNGWTVARVASLSPGLQGSGLTDLAETACLDTEQIADRLSAAGYARGPVLGPMMALRVQHVALALAGGGADLLAQYEAEHDMPSLTQYLLQIKGVGPRVAENYMRLRDLEYAR